MKSESYQYEGTYYVFVFLPGQPNFLLRPFSWLQRALQFYLAICIRLKVLQSAFGFYAEGL